MGYHTRKVQLNLRFGFLLFILSEVMFFFSFFWAYFHFCCCPTSFAGGLWPPEGVVYYIFNNEKVILLQDFFYTDFSFLKSYSTTSQEHLTLWDSAFSENFAKIFNTSAYLINLNHTFFNYIDYFCKNDLLVNNNLSNTTYQKITEISYYYSQPKLFSFSSWFDFSLISPFFNNFFFSNLDEVVGFNKFFFTSLADNPSILKPLFPEFNILLTLTDPGALVDPYSIPLVNTILLLGSSVILTLSHNSLRLGRYDLSIFYLILTIICGLLFFNFQLVEYISGGFSINDGIYGSVFYLLTGFHGFHVFIGTVFLIICLVRLFQDHFSSTSHFGYEAAIWYWHFVDVVWIFLFFFIYVWPNHSFFSSFSYSFDSLTLYLNLSTSVLDADLISTFDFSDNLSIFEKQKLILICLDYINFYFNSRFYQWNSFSFENFYDKVQSFFFKSSLNTIELLETSDSFINSSNNHLSSNFLNTEDSFKIDFKYYRDDYLISRLFSPVEDSDWWKDEEFSKKYCHPWYKYLRSQISNISNEKIRIYFENFVDSYQANCPCPECFLYKESPYRLVLDRLWWSSYSRHSISVNSWSLFDDVYQGCLDRAGITHNLCHVIYFLSDLGVPDGEFRTIVIEMIRKSDCDYSRIFEVPETKLCFKTFYLDLRYKIWNGMPSDELNEYLKRVYLPTLHDILEKCPPKEGHTSLNTFFSKFESGSANSDTRNKPIDLNSIHPPIIEPKSDSSDSTDSSVEFKGLYTIKKKKLVPRYELRPSLDGYEEELVTIIDPTFCELYESYKARYPHLADKPVRWPVIVDLTTRPYNWSVRASEPEKAIHDPDFFYIQGGWYYHSLDYHGEEELLRNCLYLNELFCRRRAGEYDIFIDEPTFNGCLKRYSSAMVQANIDRGRAAAMRGLIAMIIHHPEDMSCDIYFLFPDGTILTPEEYTMIREQQKNWWYYVKTYYMGAFIISAGIFCTIQQHLS